MHVSYAEQKDRKTAFGFKDLGHFMNILETIAPIFLIIAFGYFLKSRKILSHLRRTKGERA